MKKLTILILMLVSFILSAQKINLIYVDFPPYEYEENGEAKGVLVEIVKEIFKEADIEISLKLLPFARALMEVEEGKADGIFNFYKNEERLKKFDYSEPIIDNPLAFFIRKDSEIKYDKIEDLKDLNIGTMSGYTYGPEFDQSTLFKTDPINSHEANLKKLVLGRINAYPVDKLVGIYAARKENIMGKLKILPKPLKVMKGHIGFTKGKHSETISKINAVIQKMHEDGSIKQIIDKYVESIDL